MTYENNIGFEEMVNFYKVANNQEIEEMELLVDLQNWQGVKRLFKKVLGIKLI